MAVTNLTLTALATYLFKDTSNGNAAVVVKASAGILYAVYVDNSLNAAISYVKLFDNAEAVVVGTTVPDWVLEVPASFKGTILLCVAGAAFAAGLQVATVLTGGTAGVAPPGAAVTVNVVYT